MKKKKIKKMLKKTREMVDAQSVVIDELENRTSEILFIRERVDKLSRRLDKVEELSKCSAVTGEEIKDIKKQISVLRNRTNVNYSGMSKGNDKLSLLRSGKLCALCKHYDKPSDEPPCITCGEQDNWEAKEE